MSLLFRHTLLYQKPLELDTYHSILIVQYLSLFFLCSKVLHNDFTDCLMHLIFLTNNWTNLKCKCPEERYRNCVAEEIHVIYRPGPIVSRKTLPKVSNVRTEAAGRVHSRPRAKIFSMGPTKAGK